MSMVAILAVCGIAVSSVSLQHHYRDFKDGVLRYRGDVQLRHREPQRVFVDLRNSGRADWDAWLRGAGGLGHGVSRAPRDSGNAIRGAAAGLAFALYLTYIEARVLGVWCILCLSSLALIAMIACSCGGDLAGAQCRIMHMRIEIA